MVHLYKTYKPLNVLSMILGLPSVNFHDNQFRKSPLTVKIYNSIVATLLITYHFWSTYGKMQSIGRIQTTYAILDVLISAFTLLLLIIQVLVPSLVYTTQFCRIFRTIGMFDARLKRTDDIRTNEDWAVVALMIVGCACCICLPAVDSTVWVYSRFDQWTYYAVIYVTTFLTTINICQMTSISIFVKNRFKLINETCKHAVNYNCYVDIQDSQPDIIPMNILRIGHDQLCDVVDLMNTIYGLNIVAFTIVNALLILQTLHIFIFCFVRTDSLSDDENLGFGMQLVWMIYFSIMLFAFLLACESVEIFANSTVVVLNKLLLESFVKTEIREEIMAFADQVFERSPKITGFGFFTANRELISNLISGLITYVFVLLQFNGL